MISGQYKYDPEETSNIMPNEVYKNQSDYAKALLYGSGQQPVKHWLQGVSNMVAALMGGQGLYRAGQGLKSSDLTDASMGRQGLDPNTPEPGAPPANPTEAASSGAAEPNTPSEQASSAAIEPPAPTVQAEPVGVPADPTQLAQALSPQAAAKTPSKALPGQQPVPKQGGQVYIDPAFLPRRGYVSPAVVERMLASKRVDPLVRKAIIEKFMTQGGPIVVDDGMGGKILVNPKDPTQQLHRPNWEKGQWSPSEGITLPFYRSLVPDPNNPGGPPIERRARRENAGGYTVAPPPQGGGGGPTDFVPPPVPPAPTQTPAPATQQAASPAPDEPPDFGPGSDGFSPFGPRSMLSTNPPGASPIPPAAEAAPISPVAEAASSGSVPDVPAPPDIAPEDKAVIDWAAEKKARMKAAEENAAKDAAEYTKERSGIGSAAQTASTLIPQLELMDKLVSDQDFISGSFSGLRTNIANIYKTATKMMFGGEGSDRLGNPTLNQGFEKLKSGAILDNMRSKLEGLGQVRLAEIFLLAQSMASADNTVQANRAIIELTKRAAQQTVRLDEVARWYDKGYRLGDDGKWLRGPGGRLVVTRETPTASGLKAQQAIYLGHNPILDEKASEYMYTLLKSSKEQSTQAAPGTNKLLPARPKVVPGQNQAVPPPGFQ